MAMVFYGVAGDVYMECRGSDKWKDNWEEVDRLFDDARAEFEKAQRDLMDEMTKKEEFSAPVCTGKICVSKGKRGTIKLEVSEMFGGVEVRMHPTNIYRYGMKLSQGRQVQVGVGGVVSASASYNHYVDCTFGTGCSRGVEVGVELSGGKGVTTKVGKSFNVIRYSTENAPGTAKTGLKNP
jgi:hypothetical protein